MFSKIINFLKCYFGKNSDEQTETEKIGILIAEGKVKIF